VHKDNPPTILALAVIHDLEIHQAVAVDTAFLNADLKEDLHHSASFISEDHPDYVCNLSKSLYGLKQAPCEWFLMINDRPKKSG